MGACNDEVNAALKAQIDKGTSFGAPCELEVRVTRLASWRHTRLGLAAVPLGLPSCTLLRACCLTFSTAATPALLPAECAGQDGD